MAQYVKFMRGSPEAFARLINKDAETLYFIYEDGKSEGKLYLGDRLIAGGDIGSTSIDALKDVLISEGLVNNSLLVYDESIKSWVNKPFDDVISVFIGPTDDSSGVAGLVPAPPKGRGDLYLKSDGTWAALDLNGQEIEINGDVFAYGEDGKLNLYGFIDAPSGSQLIKGADGKLNWIKPDTTTVEGLSSAIEALREDVDNTYTKAQTEQQIAAAIAQVPHLKRKICSLEEAQEYAANNEDSLSYVFMIPSETVGVQDRYDEYMVIELKTGDTIFRTLEKVGSWEVDLTGYATKDDLKNKVDVVAGSRLITNDEAAKLNGMLNVKSVDGTLQLSETGVLGVKTITSAHISDLAELLRDKASVSMVETLSDDVDLLKARLTWGTLT